MKYPTISSLSIEDERQYKDSQKKLSLASFGEVMQYVLLEYYLKDRHYRNRTSLISQACELAPKYTSEINVFGMMYDAGLGKVLECERKPLLGEIENCKRQLLQIFVESQVNKNLNIVLTALGENKIEKDMALDDKKPEIAKPEITKAVFTDHKDEYSLSASGRQTGGVIDKEQFTGDTSSKGDKGLMIGILATICILIPIICPFLLGFLLDICILLGTLMGIKLKKEQIRNRKFFFRITICVTIVSMLVMVLLFYVYGLLMFLIGIPIGMKIQKSKAESDNQSQSR